MKSTVSLQVDTDTLLRLISQLKLRGGTLDIAEAITSAIDLWLREQSKLSAGSDPASMHDTCAAAGIRAVARPQRAGPPAGAIAAHIASASNSRRATATSPSTRHHTRRRLDLARAAQIPLPP